MFGVSGVDTAYSDYRGRTLCVASKVFRVVGRSRIRRAVKGQRGRKRRWWWWWRSDWRQQRSRWSQRGRLRPAFTSQCPSKVLDAGLVERHQPGAGAHRSLHVHQVSSLSLSHSSSEFCVLLQRAGNLELSVNQRLNSPLCSTPLPTVCPADNTVSLCPAFAHVQAAAGAVAVSSLLQRPESQWRRGQEWRQMRV